MSTQNTDTRGNLILIAVGLLALLAYWWAGSYFWPQKPPNPGASESTKLTKDQEKDARLAGSAVGGLAQPDGQPWNALAAVGAAGVEPEPGKAPEKPEKGRERPSLEIPVTPAGDLVTLGGPNSHLTVKLDPKGAGVRQILLNHFQAANPRTGEPEWEDAAHRVKRPLELVPDDKNREIASFLLYHYGDPKGEDFPLDTLGRRVWTHVKPEQADGDNSRQEAVFETEEQGVRITKKYTLEPRWYHVGLEVKLELLDARSGERVIRYQLTGAHGIPIEGQWYTSTFRNALIGGLDQKGYPTRNFQDLRTIAMKAGGDEVTRGDMSIRYAVVANQFFASGIAVAAADQTNLDFLGQARPILMESAVRGVVRKPENDDEVLLETPDRKKFTFEYAGPADRARFEGRLTPSAEVIIVHRLVLDRAGRSHQVITDVLDPTQTASVFHDDITVAVTTPKDDKAVRLKPGEPVVHKYVLYNGPVKVSLLDDHLLGEPPAVDPSLVQYYHDDLHLNTLTDYHSPGWFSEHVLAPMQWTAVVIWFTNRMHGVLWFLYCVTQYVMPRILVFGLCILLLTVLVRGVMHPFSRKQARMTMKMQALKPELDKLKEKYKDDKQALGMKQMELYRQHGINPMGSCWMMLAQMPVFLGLYYCLQESIHFRLAPFLWIKSLTSPDMLIHWGDRIPFISQWENYGAFYYLGPYFNLLPVIAVALMIMQQKYTMPPAADEQAAMQQKMMKYMMVFFGLMFYKVAAGLCLYFIASSLWGFAERKLLPKKKPGELPTPVAPGRPTLMQRMMDRLMEAQRQQAGGNGTTPRAGTTPPAPGPAGGGKKKRGRPAPVQQDGLLARVRAWWAEVLRQAEKR
jgi:YidC/Oxa1 family membrane protein insertase